MYTEFPDENDGPASTPVEPTFPSDHYIIESLDILTPSHINEIVKIDIDKK